MATGLIRQLQPQISSRAGLLHYRQSNNGAVGTASIFTLDSKAAAAREARNWVTTEHGVIVG